MEQSSLEHILYPYSVNILILFGQVESSEALDQIILKTSTKFIPVYYV